MKQFNIFTCKKYSRLTALLIIFMVLSCKQPEEKSADTTVDKEVEATDKRSGVTADKYVTAAEKANRSKARLMSLCSAGDYSLTKEVKRAYLEYAKAKARADMEAMDRRVPDDFLAWIDTDPEMEASVYSARDTPANIIMMLYSLRLDLGKEDFEKYRQLALAHAIVYEQQGSKADLSPRDPMNLVIPESPLKRVNTKDASRQLDRNDHIINFLEDHSLVASDVFASRELQVKFNDYMNTMGHKVDIDCGDNVIHPKQKKAIRGPREKAIRQAFELFRNAYIAKGRLPGDRDPRPSPAQSCAFLIKNDKEMAGFGNRNTRRPHFPLTSPWPVMTLLASHWTPLREREEIWNLYKNSGRVIVYGEYVGTIAQQPHMLAARRLQPFPFAYGSWQMMRKDGGVCGAMANLCTTSYSSLGVPASMVRQPGHAALIHFEMNKNNKAFQCKGSQFGKSGPAQTQVMARWNFGNSEKERKDKAMVYHMSIAWAINHGFSDYLDSMIAYQIFHLLHPSQEQGSIKLLESGLEINPYNALLVDDMLRHGSALELVRFWPKFTTLVRDSGKKPGCPPDGLYIETMKRRLFIEIGRRPVSKDQKAIEEILIFLEKEK